MTATISQSPKQASFWHLCSGQIVNTGCCHDIGCLPGGEDANLDEWEAGFTDGEGRLHRTGPRTSV